MLPQGTEPLVLADGTKISPIDGSVVVEDALVEVPNSEAMQREITATRLRISDLPMPPQQMNTLSVILSYTLQGVSDNDIATLLHVQPEQITNIKESDGYRELQTTIIKNIMESDSSDIRNLFVEKSKFAANKMFSLVDSQNETTAMSAAKDVLDRSGQRPVDVIEHRHKMEGGLVIQYVEANNEVPLVNITPEKEF
jgi:hypothetical protein